jgi:hypothetical protein
MKLIALITGASKVRRILRHLLKIGRARQDRKPHHWLELHRSPAAVPWGRSACATAIAAGSGAVTLSAGAVVRPFLVSAVIWKNRRGDATPAGVVESPGISAYWERAHEALAQYIARPPVSLK